MSEIDNYPKYVCKWCAEKAGGSSPAGHIVGYHVGICPCCGHLRELAAPRDFRYPKGLKVLHEYTSAIESLGNHRHPFRDTSVEGSVGSERETEQLAPGSFSKI